MKLELYKAYKTRTGHKAVVVNNISEDVIQVFHCEEDDWWYHKENGQCQERGEERDIISEWHEPRKGEFYVTIYEHIETGSVFKICEPNKVDSMPFPHDSVGSKLLARKKITWTEGDVE